MKDNIKNMKIFGMEHVVSVTEDMCCAAEAANNKLSSDSSRLIFNFFPTSPNCSKRVPSDSFNKHVTLNYND